MGTMSSVDFLIIGSGIAGASLACELAPHGSVLVCEQEDRHGYHTTGRSAAIYIESYGAAPLRRLTAASRAFFDNPPEGFCDYRLLSPRGCMNIASEAQRPALETLKAEISATGSAFDTLDGDAARALVPILKPEAVVEAVYEPNAADIDVGALHQGFLKLARARGAELRLDAAVEALERQSRGWRVRLASGEVIAARIVVNAAGAWADRIARLAGARPLGMTPMRRTIILLDPPPGAEIAAWPAVIDADEEYYFKPEAGMILASPADETPSEPLDAAPDELDIAICVDRLQHVAELPVRRVARSWAGLRTFAPDRVPVFGYAPRTEGFFWFAGQGGYGMQIAPAAARLGAALALGRAVPADILDRGLVAEDVSPARFG